MASETFTITNIADSGNVDDTGYFDLGFLYLGNFDGTICGNWLRFESLGIPNSATILTCILKITASSLGSDGDTCNVNIAFNDVDDAVAPTEYAEYIALSKTSSIGWNVLPAWTADTQYSSPELKTLLQAIINRPGFSRSSAVMILIDDNSSTVDAFREAYPSELGGVYDLYVEWTAEDAGSGQEINIYKCILTGSADGIADLELPISNFTARIVSASESYLEVTVPNALDYIEEIALRPAGDIVVSTGIKSLDDGYTEYTERARVNFEAAPYDMGSTNKTVRLSGHKTKTYSSPVTVALPAVSGVSMQTNGKLRVRCGMCTANPGDTVTWNDGDDSMVVGFITLTVSVLQQIMDITEA